MLSASCELDRHIRMLSSSCESEVEFYIHISIEAGMEYARSFNINGMHALFKRWTHHDRITCELD